jgi:hypothetical protein
VVYSQKCVRLLGLLSLGGESSMSVKVIRGTMNGKTHVGESVIG